MKKKKFDFFISYKSQNVSVVRLITDALIASGAHIWFAENEILISNYDNFQEEIDWGIDNSQGAIIFSNDAWASSIYCNREYERISKAINPFKIIDICIPPQEKPYQIFPDLRNCRSITWEDNPKEVLQFISSNTGIPLETSWMQNWELDLPLRKTFLRFGVSLNTGTLSQIPSPRTATTWNRKYGGFAGETSYYRGYINNLDIQLMVHVNPFFCHFGNQNTYPLSTQDDREIYLALQKSTRTWLDLTRYEQNRLHLFFWRGHGHLGLSYVEKKNNFDLRHRRYIFSLENPQTSDVGEVDIDIVIHTPVSPEDFCKIVPIIDQIPASLEFDSKKLHMEEFSLVSWGIVAWLIVMINVFFHLPVNNEAIVLPATFSFMIGLVIGQFLFLPFNKEAWITPLKLSVLFGPKTRFYISSVRLIDRGWDMSIGLWLGIFQIIFEAFIAIIILIEIGIFFRFVSPFYWGLAGLWTAIVGIRKIIKKEKDESKPLLL